MDPITQHIIEGVAAVKTGFDTLRSAVGLVRDVKETLPADKKEVVSRTLDEADKQIRLAEAQIAQGLGYPLCRCTFPPTPMLLVGYWRAEWAPEDGVYECPTCKRNDAESKGVTWVRYKQQSNDKD